MQTTDQTSQTEEHKNILGKNEVRMEELLVRKFVINIVLIVSGDRENYEKEDISEGIRIITTIFSDEREE